MVKYNENTSYFISLIIYVLSHTIYLMCLAIVFLSNYSGYIRSLFSISWLRLRRTPILYCFQIWQLTESSGGHLHTEISYLFIWWILAGCILSNFEIDSPAWIWWCDRKSGAMYVVCNLLPTPYFRTIKRMNSEMLKGQLEVRERWLMSAVTVALVLNWVCHPHKPPCVCKRYWHLAGQDWAEQHSISIHRGLLHLIKTNEKFLSKHRAIEYTYYHILLPTKKKKKTIYYSHQIHREHNKQYGAPF